MVKWVWPIFPIFLGSYVINNVPHAWVEAQGLEELHILNGVFHRHEPTRVVKNHCQGVHLSPLYQHEETTNASILQGEKTYEEVVEIIEKVNSSREKDHWWSYQEECVRKAIYTREMSSKENQDKDNIEEKANPSNPVPSGEGTSKERSDPKLDP